MYTLTITAETPDQLTDKIMGLLQKPEENAAKSEGQEPIDDQEFEIVARPVDKSEKKTKTKRVTKKKAAKSKPVEPDDQMELEGINTDVDTSPAVTKEMAHNALQEVNSTKGLPVALECLAKFEARKLSEMGADKYGDFVNHCAKVLA